MSSKEKLLTNLVYLDESQIDSILEQLPNSLSILESLKAKIGFTIKVAKFELEATTQKDSSALKKSNG